LNLLGILKKWKRRSIIMFHQMLDLVANNIVGSIYQCSVAPNTGVVSNAGAVRLLIGPIT
jgi:hypothetical protein